MDPITVQPIGLIHTPFKQPEGMPIQPSGGKGIEGHIDLFPEFLEGLQDLDGFSHIHLLYYFHLSQEFSLTVKPFLDHEQRGLFATRAPRRPNPIGLSTVRLIRVEANTLHIRDIDILDGTPLLDIKPHVPEFDCGENIRIGWFKKYVGQAGSKRSDQRFQ
jgi:tRNA-Thr(GGU) m(6)t(6)A37 methyltransferase TsaA